VEQMEKEIIALVSKIIKVPEDKIDRNADLFKEHSVDSLLGVEIFAALDKKYEIDLPEKKVEKVKTLNDIIAVAKEAVSKK